MIRRSVMFLSAFVVAVSCSDDPPNAGGAGGGTGGGGLSDTTGEQCTTADDCFADVMQRDDIAGEFICLDRVEGGYCTHECVMDEDCCAVEGECPEQTEHVCGPFESTGIMMCFISCEDADVGGEDPQRIASVFTATSSVGRRAAAQPIARYVCRAAALPAATRRNAAAISCFAARTASAKTAASAS